MPTELQYSIPNWVSKLTFQLLFGGPYASVFITIAVWLELHFTSGYIVHALSRGFYLQWYSWLLLLGFTLLLFAELPHAGHWRSSLWISKMQKLRMKVILKRATFWKECSKMVGKERVFSTAHLLSWIIHCVMIPSCFSIWGMAVFAPDPTFLFVVHE